MKPQTVQELLTPAEHGQLALVDRVFRGIEFSDFRIPVTAEAATIERVQFLDCGVSPGTCQIDGGTVLRQVTFANFRCGDALHIASDVFLDRVLVSGQKQPPMLWIKAPAREPCVLDYSSVEWCLDIRDFHGEVSIAGPPAEKILRDPLRHVLLDRATLAQLDWSSLGIDALSYWKIMAKKYRESSAQACVVSTPSQKGRNYERSMRELMILRSNGLVS